MNIPCLALLLCAVASGFPSGAAAKEVNPQNAQDLSQLSIEELAQLSVRSASKTNEPLSAAPAALYVITSDDIQRSNATTLPEALRLAPNLQVEQLNASQYSITARGFNGFDASNKLLVLIDGRSIYSTLHSGVFWDLQAPLIEDIDQVEVISGPGGTLYGPNAVNGVININSRDARDTIGLLARGTAGDAERTAAARYGVSLGELGAVRVYGNYYDREGFGPGPSLDPDDGIRGWQAGFRADLNAGAGQVTLQGDLFDNDTFFAPGEGSTGKNLLARWTTPVSRRATFEIQGYYDVFRRRSQRSEDFLETFDGQAQLNLDAGIHQIVAGFGARTTRDRYTNHASVLRLTPRSQQLWLVNGFAQDRIAIDDQVALTAGLKLEQSSYSGLQLLPNLRASWQPNASHLLWAAVSRAVRTPSRVDREVTGGGIAAPSPEFRSEKLVALETGYRGQAGRSTSFSLNLFFNIYDDLRTMAYANGKSLPYRPANDMAGHSYGAEAWANRQIARWWRLSAGATWLVKDFHVRDRRLDLSDGAWAGHDPDYQLQFRSQMTLPHGFTLDAALRSIDGLEDADVAGYTEADARIGWNASDHLELYVAGDNLLHDRHIESDDVIRTQSIPRTVHAGARIRF